MVNKTLLFRRLQILLVAFLFGVSFYPYAGEAIFPLIGISVAFGFVTWLGVSLIFDSYDRWDVTRLVRVARQEKRCRNGQRRAVLGRIYPLDEPIKAPFSGRECLIVTYDIYHSYWKRTKSGSTHLEPIIYSGYILAPCEVRTSTESIRVLGFPNISDVSEQETTSYGKHTAFLETTDFTPLLRSSFMEGVNDISKVIHVDENGAAAENYKFRELVPGQSVKSREKVVKKGEDVCLIGKFDAVRGAIVPGRFRFGQSLRLISGTGEQIVSGLKKSAGTVFVVGIVVSLLCISAGLLPHAPDSMLEQLPFGDKMITYRNKVLPP